MQSGVPSVSVVMSVYDRPDDVVSTVESVLEQKGINLNFVVVCDGASPEVVSALKGIDDVRLTLVYQTNQGLTVALIRGCAEAKYDFIARIDTGDHMLPGRLVKQAHCLLAHPDVGLVSCWVTMHTEEGFILYDVKHSETELHAGLTARREAEFKSPVHASVMFRRSAYIAAGAYREEFYFAQDCDLWARMLVKSKIKVIAEPLQRCLFSASGISGRYRNLQSALAKLVVEGNRLREQGEDDSSLLSVVRGLRPAAAMEEAVSIDEFDGNYFIASVLGKTQPEAALVYWRKVLSERPWHLRARLKWGLCWLRLA